MVAFSSPNISSHLKDYFVTALQEIYWSEFHLVNVLETMSNAATSTELKEAFAQHRQQTQEHVKRLESAFEQLGMEAQAEPSAGLQGLFDEGWQVIDESEAGSAQRDVALIIAAQKVEHYEIACYGSLITLAKTIGLRDLALTLGSTLEEEKETDALLTSIAEGGINEQASQEQDLKSSLGEEREPNNRADEDRQGQENESPLVTH